MKKLLLALGLLFLMPSFTNADTSVFESKTRVQGKMGRGIGVKPLRKTDDYKINPFYTSIENIKGNAEDLEPPILTIDPGYHKERITDLLFTKDGRYIVSVSWDKTIRKWHVKSGKVVTEMRGQIGEGEDGKILAAAVSYDYDLMAVGGCFGGGSTNSGEPQGVDVGSVRLINLHTGKIVSLLKGHRGPVRSLKFSKDGKKLISGSLDRVVIWNVTTQKIQCVLESKRKRIGNKSILTASVGLPIDISSDGARAISGGNLWNASTGALIALLKHPQKDYYLFRTKNRGIRGINDAFIRALSDSQKKQIIDSQTGWPYEQFWERHNGPWTFAPDGKYIVSNIKNELLLWDGYNGKFISFLGKHLKPYKCNPTFYGDVDIITFSMDGSKMITGSWHGPARQKSIRNIFTFSPSKGRVLSKVRLENIPRGVTAVSPDGRTVAIGNSADNTITLLDINTGRTIKIMDLDTGRSSLWTKNVDESRIAVQAADGYAELAEEQTVAQTRATALAIAKVRALEACKKRIEAETDKDHDIIWPEAEGSVSVLEQKDLGIEEDCRYHVRIKAEVPYGIMPKTSAANLRAGKIWGVGFSKDGRYIAWCKKHRRSNVFVNVPLDQSFQLWNEQGEPQIELGPVLKDDSAYLRTIDTNGSLSIFTSCNILYDHKLGQEKDDKKQRRSIHNGISNVYSYTFTPDGNLVISGGDEGKLIAHDLEGRPVREFIGHSGNIWGVAVSPNGRFMVSGSDDQTVKLWRLDGKNRRVQPTLTIYHGTDNEWVAWTPEGYYVSSEHGDKYIGWHFNNGEDKSADYYSAFQFERIFYRPDYVHAKLRVNEDQGKDAPGFGGDFFDISKLALIAPPKITIHSPAYGDNGLPGSKAVLDFSVEKNSLPMINYSVFVNNIPVIPYKKRSLEKIEQHAFSRKMEMPLFNDINKVRIEVFNGKSMGIADTLIYNSEAVGQKQTKGDLYLLAAGANHFIHMPEHNLKYAAQDAENFAGIFRQDSGKTYNHKFIKVISDNSKLKPSKENILQALEFLKNARAEDTVIVFLASHGVSDYAGNYYFMPSDALEKDTESLLSARTRGITISPLNMSSFISWETFFDVLRSVAGKRLLVVDTCQAKRISGTLDIHSLAKRSASSSFALLVASKGDELSQEYPQGKHGLFTYAMLSGLNGHADRNKDGQISLNELHAFIFDFVKTKRDQKLGEQTPQLVGPTELKSMVLKKSLKRTFHQCPKKCMEIGNVSKSIRDSD